MKRTPPSTPDKSPQKASRWTIQPMWFAYIGLFGLLGLLHPVLEPLRVLTLSSLIYLVLIVGGWLYRLVRPEAPSETAAPAFPLPGPAERRGVSWFMGRYGLSSTLTLLNPLQFTQMMLQLGGQAVAWMRRRSRKEDVADWRSSVVYTLPVQGEWLVFNGGATPETSHSWDVLNQRYAADLVQADAEGRRHAPGAGDDLASYLCYGAPIVAPADGVVVRVRDGVRDAPAPGTGWIDWLSPDVRGNFVVIRHAPDEYSLLAHLIPGRIAVRARQTVRRGDLIGVCGNSGHSTEPHLHMHLQDHPNPHVAIGLPWHFAHVAVDGRAPQDATLERGTRVAHGEAQT